MSGNEERMQKIVINARHGGFGLSNEACERLIELGYVGLIPVPDEDRPMIGGLRFYGGYEVSRTHPLLIQVIKELGVRANGPHANLKIVEIPNGISWSIEEYDGFEHIAENHRTWG